MCLDGCDFGEGWLELGRFFSFCEDFEFGSAAWACEGCCRLVQSCRDGIFQVFERDFGQECCWCGIQDVSDIGYSG